jgi:hypothetical protein
MRKSRSRVAAMATSLIALLAIAAPVSAAKPPKQPVVLYTQTTPGSFTWTVPIGVRRVTFEVYGAAGGRNGGLGGKATGTFSVRPGQVIQIVVGGQGSDSDTPGFNGGGTGYSSGNSYGGGGGGASDIRVGACAFAETCGLETRIVVGGGGGGSGGGLEGGTGAGDGGTGGTQTSGGVGPGGDAEAAGTFGSGGDHGPGGYASGGGGGGWFGGGGGGQNVILGRGAGGGGSGHVSPLALSWAMESAVQSGDGMVVITKG